MSTVGSVDVIVRETKIFSSLFFEYTPATARETILAVSFNLS